MMKIFVMVGIVALSAIACSGAGVVSLLLRGIGAWLEMLLWLALFATMIGGWTWVLSGFRPWPAITAAGALVVAFLLGRLEAILVICAEQTRKTK